MLNFEVLKALALLCKSKEKEPEGFRCCFKFVRLPGYLVGRSDRPAVGTDSRAEVISVGVLQCRQKELFSCGFCSESQ
eukprot:438865-Rhodomonas_salina.1